MASITKHLRALVEKFGGEANGKTISGCLEDLCGCEIGGSGGGGGFDLILDGNKALRNTDGENTPQIAYDMTAARATMDKVLKGEPVSVVYKYAGNQATINHAYAVCAVDANRLYGYFIKETNGYDDNAKTVFIVINIE